MSGTPGQLAVLFADISGSTQLYHRLGDHVAHELVTQSLDLLREEMRRHGGTLIKTIGDELMITFPDAESALLAARAMQERFAKEAPLDARAWGLRTGLHYGPVLLEEKDVFGDTVNVAARVVGAAKAGQIVTTRGVVDRLPTALVGEVREFDRALLRGKDSELELFEFVWQRADATTMTRVPAPPGPNEQQLELYFQGTRLVVDPEHPCIRIGRQQANDVVTPSSSCSRQHARVELRHDHFVLIDESTNGTFVISEGGQRRLVHRDELPLEGSGWLRVGSESGDADELRYVCG